MSNTINPFDYGKAWCQEFLFPDGGYDSRTWPRIRFSIEADSLGIFCNNTDLGKIAVSGILFNRRSDAILFDEAKAKILLGGPASIADSLHTHSGVGSLALDDLSDVNAPAPNDQDVLTWDAGAGEWVA